MNLKPKTYNLKPNLGFTLVEIFVVVVITAMISAFAITYSKIGQRQVALYVEEQKVASLIQKARSLAITIYSQGPPGSQPVCGYGLAIDYSQNTYSFFAYNRPAGPPSPTICESINNIDLGLIDKTPSAVPAQYINIPLGANIKFNGAPADALRYVLFVAPNPRTIVSNDPGGIRSAMPVVIHLETMDGKGSVTITVNTAGQVDF